MDQYLSIRAVQAILRNVIPQVEQPELAAQLREVDARLETFHDRGIDFKEVVDNLDDSVLITDADGLVLYINPAYTRNTGITEGDILNRDIHSVIGEDKLFTGGAVTSVLENKKSAFRLSTTYKTEEPLVGYVVGTPILKQDGSLRQVIACSRPIVTLNSLQEDFEAFVKEVNAIRPGYISKDSDKHLSEGMVGKYGSLEKISTLIDHVAPTDASVLITGESGVGKEVVADEIYRRSLRRDKPYVKINCASIPGHLLESELFGYEKGAFTGANAKGKIGLFEYANHGTLMLDEIGDSNPEIMEFATEFESRTGFAPNMMMTCAYDAMNMLAKAIENCGDNVTRAAIRDQLFELEGFEGLTGPKVFNEDRTITQRNFKIVTIENGAWKTLTDSDYID